MQLGEGLEDSKTDWKRLKEMKGEDIDCSDIPPLDENFWKNAVIVKPDTTVRITVSSQIPAIHTAREFVSVQFGEFF